MNLRKNRDYVPTGLDRLITEITVDAYGDNEQLWAFRQAFDDDVTLPAGGFVNRPFLRCMHGYDLCLWRLDQFDAAESVFDRMFWLNPSDNQGVRFLIDDVRAGTAWEEREVK